MDTDKARHVFADNSSHARASTSIIEINEPEDLIGKILLSPSPRDLQRYGSDKRDVFLIIGADVDAEDEPFITYTTLNNRPSEKEEDKISASILDSAGVPADIQKLIEMRISNSECSLSPNGRLLVPLESLPAIDITISRSHAGPFAIIEDADSLAAFLALPDLPARSLMTVGTDGVYFKNLSENLGRRSVILAEGDKDIILNSEDNDMWTALFTRNFGANKSVFIPPFIDPKEVDNRPQSSKSSLDVRPVFYPN